MTAVAAGRITALALAVLGAGFALSANASTTVSGVIEDGTVWTAAGSPYVADDVTISEGDTLTIEPGVVVKFKESDGLSVFGTLVANGSDEEKIYFTSLKDDTVGGDTNGDGAATTPSPQDWQQLRIFGTGEAAIEHAVVRYGGDPFETDRHVCGTNQRHCRGGIANVGMLALTDSTLAHNYGYGLYHQGGTSTVERTVIRDTPVNWNVYAGGGTLELRDSLILRSPREGLLIDQGTEQLVVTDTTFRDNDGASADIDASVEFIHRNNISETDALRAFRIRNVFDEDATWTKDGLPYVLESTVTVPEDVTLTIEPGVVIKGDESSGLAVHGELLARGTDEEKVHFTSLKDDSVGGDTNGDGSTTAPAPDDWTQIRNFITASTSIAHAVLRYGGDTHRPGLNNCGVGIKTCRGAVSNVGTLTVTESEFRDNLQRSIYQTDGTSTITRVNFTDTVFGPAVKFEGGVMTVRESSFADNHQGIVAELIPETVDARENWWGNDTGPFHETLNPDGLGVEVVGNVLFDTWLTNDPFEEPEIDPLILQYEPILYLHPDENYAPMNVEAFIEASALWDENGISPDTQLKPASDTDPVTVDDIAVPVASEDWYLAFSVPDAAKTFDPAIAETKYDILKNSGKAVPTYYAHKMDDHYLDEDGTKHEFIVLQYWYFYAFNDWEVHEGFNNHEGDWESVFVFLDKGTKDPLYVAYSSHHNDGEPSDSIIQYSSVRRDWDSGEITKVNEQIVSFVSLGSHANYPNNNEDGVHVTGVGDDLTSSEGSQIVSETWNEKTSVNTEVPPWMLYQGKWGADSLLDIGGGESGPEGPRFNNVSGVVRFFDPIEWAGINNISTKTVEEETGTLTFFSDTILMFFEELLSPGTTVSVDQHDELITFGEGLESNDFLPHFWDLESSLGDELPTTTVTFAYDETEATDFGIIENDLSTYFFNEDTNTWEMQSSDIDIFENTVSFTTGHFSRYALGAPRWETITEDVEVKRHWSQFDPHSGTREASVGIDGATGTVRLLITPTEDDVHLINNTGTTTDGTLFIDVALDEKSPFDTELLFSVPAQNASGNGTGNSKGPEHVSPMLNFDFRVEVRKVLS